MKKSKGGWVEKQEQGSHGMGRKVEEEVGI